MHVLSVWNGIQQAGIFTDAVSLVRADSFGDASSSCNAAVTLLLSQQSSKQNETCAGLKEKIPWSLKLFLTLPSLATLSSLK